MSMETIRLYLPCEADDEIEMAKRLDALRAELAAMYHNARDEDEYCETWRRTVRAFVDAETKSLHDEIERLHRQCDGAEAAIQSQQNEIERLREQVMAVRCWKCGMPCPDCEAMKRERDAVQAWAREQAMEEREQRARAVADLTAQRREAFRMGYLATVDKTSDDGWGFDGPGAADREPEAWAAWQRRLAAALKAQDGR